MMKLGIKIKLLAVSLVVGILPLTIATFLISRTLRLDLEKEIRSYLSQLTEAKEGQILAYLKAPEARTTDFASDGFIRDALKEILINRTEETVEALNRHLLTNKKPLDETLVGISVKNVNGVAVAATDEAELGREEPDNEYFIKGKEGVYAAELRDEKHYGLSNLLVVAAPLTDKDTGDFLGVLVNYFDTNKLQQILSGAFQTKLGVLPFEERRIIGLELTLIDREKKIFVSSTPTTYDHAPGTVYDPPPVEKCLNQNQEVAETYLHHTGKEVIGVSGCMTDRGWVLLAEISTKEAFAPVAEIQLNMIIIMVLTGLLVMAISLLLSRGISGPIMALDHAVGIIGHGNLDYRSDIKTGDEIERLGESFNKMASNLQEKNQKLEAYLRQIKEERARLKASIRSLNMAFFTTDAKGTITMMNPVAEQIFCHRGKTNRLETDSSHHWADRPCTIKDIGKNLKGILDIEAQIHKTLKERRLIDLKEVSLGDNFLHLIIAPVIVGGREAKQVTGTVVVAEDITAAKMLERSKDEFLSIASHELRTPLTAIRGNISIMKEFYAKKIRDSNLKEMVDDIHASSVRLIELVNDFLNVSRVEQGRIQFNLKEFNPLALVVETLHELERLAKEKNLSLTVLPPKRALPAAFADKERVKQVLINLVGNALKFTTRGGVTIRLDRENGSLRIAVQDTGRGITTKDQTFLFRKFQQAGDLYTRDVTGGTGLGLYISKLLVEKMGGRIYLESSVVGKGSTFVFTLPIAKSSVPKV